MTDAFFYFQTQSGQYVITGWTMETVSIKNYDGQLSMISVTMGMKRQLISIFMVIYLPLIIMNILNQGQESHSYALKTKGSLDINFKYINSPICNIMWPLPSLVLPDDRGPAPDGDQREHHVPAGARLGVPGCGHQPAQHLLHQAGGGVPHLQPRLPLPHHPPGRGHTGALHFR